MPHMTCRAPASLSYDSYGHCRISVAANVAATCHTNHRNTLKPVYDLWQ